MKDSMAHKISFWLGIAITVVTHVYMLMTPLPESMMMGHAILNLVAVALVLFAVL